MLTLKLLEWRKSIAQLCSQYREKALHVSLTICTSQRPRQNINVHSRPNLRGLRTGKPTTSCLCFCFKLNRVKNATNKRFHEQKKQSKSFARVLKTCHMVCWSRGLASSEIVETSSHLLNYWDKYRFLFNRPFLFRRWPDCLKYLVPQSCLIHTGLEDTKTWSNFISHRGNSQPELIVIGTAWNNKNTPGGIPRPWLV